MTDTTRKRTRDLQYIVDNCKTETQERGSLIKGICVDAWRGREAKASLLLSAGEINAAKADFFCSIFVASKFRHCVAWYAL